MTAINGHVLSPDEIHVAEISTEVAEAVYSAMLDEGDEPWPDLTDEERELLAKHAELHIAAHIIAMQSRGMRMLPPGSIPKPASEPEAMAMVKAAKAFFDGQKRKPGLLAGTVRKPKLILPPGMH